MINRFAEGAHYPFRVTPFYQTHHQLNYRQQTRTASWKAINISLTTMKLITILPLIIASSTDAFVERLSVVRPISTTREKTVGNTSLNLLEPSQLFDHAVSTLLASDATTVGPPEAGGVSYSKASYYTILGLYLLSFPGLWSTIKRSTKAKVKRKTFVTKGEKASKGTGKSLREEAGGIMACK